MVEEHVSSCFRQFEPSLETTGVDSNIESLASQTSFLPVDLTLAWEMRIFIVTLAVFCILITKRCDHARSEDVCVAKRFFSKKAQGKPL